MENTTSTLFIDELIKEGGFFNKIFLKYLLNVKGEKYV